MLGEFRNFSVAEDYLAITVYVLRNAPGSTNAIRRISRRKST